MARNFRSWVQIVTDAAAQTLSADPRREQFLLWFLLIKPVSLEGHGAQAQVM